MVLILTTGQGRSTLLRVGHMLFAAVSAWLQAVATEFGKSAGTMPYGAAIAAGTLAMLLQRQDES
ncbi:hypothetical protein ACTMU2_24275 [Cupriavidus basilensis]